MAKARGVIFDLDGTLYEMPWYMRPLIAVLIFPHVMRLPRFIAAHGSYAGVDLGSRDELLNRISARIVRRNNHTAGEMRQWIERKFYPAFVLVTRIMRSQRRPALRRTLEALRDAGVKTAALSDYGRTGDRLKALMIPPHLFDRVASSEEYGALKPASRPFLDIANEWKLSPGEVLVVGDRIDTDGASAAHAGMQFLLVGDRGGCGSSWTEVTRHLMGLCRKP